MSQCEVFWVGFDIGGASSIVSDLVMGMGRTVPLNTQEPPPEMIKTKNHSKNIKTLFSFLKRSDREHFGVCIYLLHCLVGSLFNYYKGIYIGELFLFQCFLISTDFFITLKLFRHGIVLFNLVFVVWY